MKTITRLLGLFAVVVMFIFLDACKAEKGEVGPAGPAGVAGPTGANGANGAIGATGATGTANVIYGAWIDQNNTSYWYKLASTNVGGTTNYQGHGWGSDFAAPVTQDILDKGLILVYGKFVSSDLDKRVYLLPNNFWGRWSVQVNATLNRIYVYTVWDTAETVPATYSPTSWLTQYRYIIIPGSVNGRRANLDYSDYEAVKKAYNIKD